MTTAEMFEQMKTELDDRVAQLRSAMNEMQASCCRNASIMLSCCAHVVQGSRKDDKTRTGGR